MVNNSINIIKTKESLNSGGQQFHIGNPSPDLRQEQTYDSQTEYNQ
jgi:hypothetical protein